MLQACARAYVAIACSALPSRLASAVSCSRVSAWFALPLRLLQPPPRLQRARHRPRLRRRAARRVRRGAVEDLAHRAQRRIEQVVAQRLEPRLRRCRVAAHAILGQRVVPEQERPHRPLVIAAVALPHAARVMRAEVAMDGRQAAQAIRGEQFAPAQRAPRSPAHSRSSGLYGRLTAKIWLGRTVASSPSGPSSTSNSPSPSALTKRWKPSRDARGQIAIGLRRQLEQLGQLRHRRTARCTTAR